MNGGNYLNIFFFLVGGGGVNLVIFKNSLRVWISEQDDGIHAKHFKISPERILRAGRYSKKFHHFPKLSSFSNYDKPLRASYEFCDIFMWPTDIFWKFFAAKDRWNSLIFLATDRNIYPIFFFNSRDRLTMFSVVFRDGLPNSGAILFRIFPKN